MVKILAPAPERTCIVTRKVRPAASMLRFVLVPDGVLVPDIKGRLPGRGVYVSLSARAVRQAMKKNAFARSLKAEVKLPPDLDGMIDGLLKKTVLQALSLANKAGAIIAGHAKVESALEAQSLRALVHALDASDDGVRKLSQVVHRLGQTGKIAELRLLTSAELDHALGRSNSVHIGVLSGDAGALFLRMAGRYSDYRNDSGEESQEIVSNPDEICDNLDEISGK